MAVVRLEGLEFFAYHGYYNEEQKLGNRYTVDISLTLDIKEAAENDDLEGTVNYENVYTIISSVMESKAKLIEHLVFKINTAILSEFSTLKSVESKVYKHNPPLKGICKYASVTLRTDR